MPRLDSEDKKKLLRTMLLSRMGDLREQSLIRQGRGWFHVSGMGHEALAVAGYLLREGDFFAGYYRDRPIALARGVDSYDLAKAFFAKRASASAGRQMPAHYSNRERGIFSIASVVAANLLPATGLAWAIQLDQRPHAVLATVGDAATRQGEFFEAVAFAIEKNLPIVFLVEDNGIGISTTTDKTHPLALRLLDPQRWTVIDGCSVDEVFTSVQPALAQARSGKGPGFLWCRTERISNHSSADDQRKYRSSAELDALPDKDPLHRLKQDLVQQQILSEDRIADLESRIKEEVRLQYQRAWEEADPQSEDLLQHIFGPPVTAPPLPLPDLGPQTRIVDAINNTFHAALDHLPQTVFFGQDIADPKGGVFSLTRGLSSKDPLRVCNSPLAESTIIGAAAGMAAYGKRPVFEIQFTDFIWPGFNQLVTQLATLHWRSNGEWSAPAVIYAPYGAYLPGGAIWHSQTNESVFAHFPGLQIAVPSTPADAAGLFWSAFHDNSPSLLLIPKHLIWNAVPLTAQPVPVPFGQAAIRQSGKDLTVLTYGNGTEVVSKALAQCPRSELVEWIDLRSIAPIDWSTIEQSVSRTGRLLIVQEDGQSCSVGQHIIATLTAQPDRFAAFRAPPTLLAKPDVNIGYHPNLEYAALPSPESVAAKISQLLDHQNPSPKAFPPHPPEPPKPEAPGQAQTPTPQSTVDAPEHPSLTIEVPVLGEGITAARLCNRLKQAGDSVKADEALCELETDKALFPVESPRTATVLRWLVNEEDEVQPGQPLLQLSIPSSDSPASPDSAAYDPPIASHGGLPAHLITRLKDVVPAHLSVRAHWQPVYQARRRAKQNHPDSAPSPTAIVGFAVVQAMRQHPVFCSTINRHQSLSLRDPFDFGIAVALEDDALDTAVIPRASSLTGPQFFQAYREAVAEVAAGRSRSKANVPLILTSMGRFAVREATPLVVPPAIATLFLGSAYPEFQPPDQTRLTVALCLSFDHRWLNGAAAAAFIADVQKSIESIDPQTALP